jgi:hypothetical protein
MPISVFTLKTNDQQGFTMRNLQNPAIRATMDPICQHPIQLQPQNGGDADIRVTVVPGGSWSIIGTGARGKTQDEATMNFGWFNDQTTDNEFSRVIIHEFGLALGCIHEQASPVANIPWDRPVVYTAYLASNGWGPAMVDATVFAVAPQSETIESAFDRTSIM